MTSNVAAVLTDPLEFVVRERFHVLVLFLAPLTVFLGGLYLVLQPPSLSMSVTFLDSLGGLFLCVGAILVYAIIIVRRVAHEVPILRQLASAELHLTSTQKVQRLGLFFVFFLVSWAIRALYGFAGNIVFQVLMIVFGMLAVTLVAHFHAHHRIRAT